MSDNIFLPSSEKEDWMNTRWRPMMGWMYMAVCICDFVLFPICWSIIQAVDAQGQVGNQWSPITLQGAGLFHIAMGAILGIAVYGRTQEKLAGMLDSDIHSNGNTGNSPYGMPNGSTGVNNFGRTNDVGAAPPAAPVVPVAPRVPVRPPITPPQI